MGENLALTASLRRSRQPARVQGRHLARITEETELVATNDPEMSRRADRAVRLDGGQLEPVGEQAGTS